MSEYEYLIEKPVVVSKHNGFKLVEIKGRQYVDCRGPDNFSLRDYLESYLENEVDGETVEDFGHQYPVNFLVEYIDVIANMGHKDAAPLVTLLKDQKQKRVAAYSKRQEKGMVEMGDVETVYPVGTEIVCQSDDDIIGGIVKQIKIQHSFFGGPYFSVKLSVIHAVKGEVQNGFYFVNIPGFRGLVKKETLPIRVPTAADKQRLADRGKLFAEFYKPGTYAAYQGVLVQPSWWSARTFRADGRVVIDPISFERQEPEIFRNCMQDCGVNVDRDYDRTAKLTKKVEVDPNDYWRCLPVLYGFSLAVKQWGRLDLDGMAQIKWRDDAWDKLVVDEDEKDMIHSLVKFHGTGFTDIIEGKGGGCIFLLHGAPGWGKTASAEAVAELLHKPLYSVGVGELGVDTVTLEAKLRSILDVATIWDAVLLLDEADIFLEERDDHNIERNAMVGVFLRLLEYHNGVLFLTTNRVKNIDKAFYSRISVALHYTSEGKSHKIWTNLLSAAGLNPKWADALTDFGVNGRQIKNSIRMAQTLARAKGREVEVGDLVRSVKAALRFETDMAKKNAVATTKPRTRKKTTSAAKAQAA